MVHQRPADLRDGFTIERTGSEFRLRGVIDELANLDFLGAISGQIVLNLRDVRRINSVGVRQWMEAVRSIPPTATVELHEARPPIIDQINVIAGFLGRARLVSFYAPLVCPKCDTQTEVLHEVEACRGRTGLPSRACSKCGTTMELDDVEEDYLSFLLGDG